MSDLDEYKKERQALIEARKVKATVPDEELEKKSEDDKKIVPKTFKQKWDNYWYHYKWATFGTIAGVAILFSFIWQMAHPTVYDTTISFVSTVPFESLTDTLETAFDPYVEDYSKNGKKEIELAIYTMSDPNNTEGVINGQAEMATQMKLVARLSLGEEFLFIVDDVGYEKMADQMETSFEDLAKYSDSPNVEGDKYRLNGTKLLKEMGMEGWESNLYLCFMDFSVYGEKVQKKQDLIEKHENSLKVLEGLLAVG